MKKSVFQLFIYLIVGGIATIVEWICFYLLDHYLNLHYMIATSLAFVVSTFFNWLFGRLLLFKEGSSNLMKELIQIYGASVFGLLMNLFIMWILIDHIGINEMISKMVATGIVFFWNFFIRKLVIYSEKGNEV